ncbi:hypothetical protein BSPWISOXPB_9895 [uncultured Gammaproteobacteria bacterium]|nr:hypothetical protein BSPWISOXPB_9895 [uncultured Gammaproteobacteria bacterium]
MLISGGAGDDALLGGREMTYSLVVQGLILSKQVVAMTRLR